MKKIKFKISVFNRYLILLIVLLFSYLSYLSLPSFYKFDLLKNDLTNKLLKEFNLNASFSDNIKYSLLPWPNFEIKNVYLSINRNKTSQFAQIKKIRVYLNLSKLHSQKKYQIKKIVFMDSNIDINKNSYNYINNYLKNIISDKKIEILKSKIFFTKNNNKKDPVAISTIYKSELFYDKKNNINKSNIKGSIFNTNFTLNFLRKINTLNPTTIDINFEEINFKIKNESTLIKNNQNNYMGNTTISFLNNKNIFNYQLKEKVILLKSQKNINVNNIDFDGTIYKSPFYFNLSLYLKKIDTIKFINIFYQLKHFLNNNILLNEKFNGQGSIHIENLDNFKFFDNAKINLKFINEGLLLDNTSLTSNKIGKLIFLESSITEKDNQQFLKAKILFNIINEKKFYQKFQIPKNNRIKIKNIFLQIEQNLNSNDVKFIEFIFNHSFNDNSLENTINVANLINIDEIQKLKNWIELKKFINHLFSRIN